MSLPEKRAEGFILAALFLLALGVALLPARHVFEGGRVFFFDGDNYVHLRKMLLHIAAFPRFVTFDRYDGFPVGTGAIWPPLLDYLLSAAALAFGLGHPTPRLVQVLAALVPPVLGGLTAIALYRLARRLFGRGVALVAAALLPIIPAFFRAVVVGRPDNEMTETLMTVLMLSAYFTVQELGPSGGRSAYAAAARLGLTMFGALLLWRGAPSLIALLVVAAVADSALDFAEARASTRHLPAAVAFLLPALALAPLCALNVWGNTNTMSFNFVSWFHVVFFGSSSAVVFAGGHLTNFWLRRGFPKRLFLPGVVLGAGACILVALVVPTVKRSVVTALGVLGIGTIDPWLESIAQYQPFFSSGGYLRSMQQYGWTFWLMPLAWVLMLRGGAKAEKRPRAVYVLTSVLLLALLLLRSRFGHIYAPCVAVGAGMLLTAGYHFLRGAIGNRLRVPAKVPALAITTVFAAVLFYAPAISIARLSAGHPGITTRGDIQEAMEWLRLRTPREGVPFDPTTAPTYAVMAPWFYAGWILAIGERPVVATMYGSEAPGLRDSSAFYTAEIEEEANKILERNGARYVVCMEMPGSIETFAKIVGRGTGEFFRYVDVPGRGAVGQPMPGYYRLLFMKLLLADGIDLHAGGTLFRGAALRYRLVYESAGRLDIIGAPMEIKRLKIFEHLPGASVVVRTSPGQRVEARATVITNRGRSLPFSRAATADAEGRAVLVLPYSARTLPDGVGLVGPYTISAGDGRSASFTPMERDLLEGRSFHLALP